MNIHTLSEHVPVKPSIAVAARTTALNGSVIDTGGYDKALVLLQVAAHDRTTGDEVLDVTVEESSDNAVGDAFAAVAGAAFTQIAGQAIAASKGNTYLMEINLKKRERYLRAVGTPGGTTPIDSYSVTFILYRGTNAPVSQDAAVISV